MIRAVIAVVALIFGAGIVVAQQDAATTLQALMKENGKNMYSTGLSGMVRGTKPYDQAAVDAAFAQFEDTAKQLPTLSDAAKAPVPGAAFSPSSKMLDNKADFQAKIANFVAQVAAAKATVKDLDSLKAAWPILNSQGCEGCHETYRIKNG